MTRSRPSTNEKTASSKPKKDPHSFVGAPAQHNQGGRKGKRAWRKNIDIDEVEEGLEGLRAEERVTGTILQKKKDDELFQIDLEGDNKIRKSLPRFSAAQLTSTKILSQRSAVPAVFSRTTTTSAQKRGGLSSEEKTRLLRIAKRLRRGPFNSVLDPTEYASGSTILELSGAVKNSGTYDPWVPVEEEEKVDQDVLGPSMKIKVKAPSLPHPRDLIELPAVVNPHPGTSYNPPASSHQELLQKAHEIEEQRERKVADSKKKMGHVESAIVGVEDGVALGMTVDLVQSDDDKDGEADENYAVVDVKKLPNKKTKQQRNKAAKLLAEKRLLAEKASKKRMLNTINSAKQLRRSTSRILTTREKTRAERQRVLQQRVKLGLAGKKIGKYRVPNGEVDVQLGEELSESLRGLKPEGNLFRDRFLSLQHRALIEPRVPVLPTKRAPMKEYEKHAWKRFE